MKKKMAIGTIATVLLLMLSLVAFSQNNGNATQGNERDSLRGSIESVTTYSGGQYLSVTFSHLNHNEEYHATLYNFNGEQINNFWVDGDNMTLYVGSIQPGNYVLMLMRNKEIVDRKQLKVD